MFGKITKQQVSHSFHKAKNFIGHAYNQTKGVLNHVDHRVQTFKQIYDVVSPLVSKYAIIILRRYTTISIKVCHHIIISGIKLLKEIKIFKR